MKTIATILALSIGWIAQPGFAASDAFKAPANLLTCRVLEQAALGQQPAIEDTTLTQPIKVMSSGGFSVQFAEIKYTTKDGLFGITVEASKPVAGRKTVPN